MSDEDRRRLWKLGAIPIVLALVLWLGQALTAILLDPAPLVLLGLNASDPFLVLTAHQTAMWAWISVAFARLFLPDLFLYQIGLDYGPNTKAYLDREFGPGNSLTRALGWIERWFPRFGLLLLFVLPGYPMCLVSGISRMNRVVFIIVNVAGTLTRLMLYWWVSGLFSGPLGSAVRVINRYSIPVTAAMVVLVVVQAGRAARKAEAPRSD